MQKKLFFCCGIAVVLIGCKQTVKKTESASPTDSDRLFSSQPLPEHAYGYTGFYRSANNAKIFFTCSHPSSRFWVNDGTGKMDSFYEKAIASGNIFPENYVMAEINGRAEIAAAEIKSRGYDSILNVRKVEKVEAVTKENNCSPFEFWAGGKNPDWSIEVSRSENLIRLRLSTSQNTLLFPYLAPQMSKDSVFTYRTENVATGQSLLAIFRSENCASSELSYSAHIIYSGLKLNGCALKGSSY